MRLSSGSAIKIQIQLLHLWYLNSNTTANELFVKNKLNTTCFSVLSLLLLNILIPNTQYEKGKAVSQTMATAQYKCNHCGYIFDTRYSLLKSGSDAPDYNIIVKNG